jgi:hypothetical protein
LAHIAYHCQADNRAPRLENALPCWVSFRGDGWEMNAMSRARSSRRSWLPRSIGGLALALAALLLSITTVEAAVGLTFSFLWPNPPVFDSNFTGNGLFAHPVGAVVNSSGNVFITDNTSDWLQEFDSTGHFIAQVDGMTISGKFINFAYLFGIAVDASDYLYVGDRGNYQVRVFDKNLNYVRSIGAGSYGSGNGQFGYEMSGIAVDSGGNVYVADYDNGRVEIFNSSGQWANNWGGNGSSLFAHPTGIAIDAHDNVYVLDAGTGYILIFNTSGNLQHTWNGSAGGGGLFNGAEGVAVDSSDNVYIADTYSQRVQIFASDGTFESTFGSSGSGNGQFTDPYGLAVGNNSVYVTDFYNYRVEALTIATLPSSPTATGTSTRTPTLPPRVFLPSVEDGAPAGW